MLLVTATIAPVRYHSFTGVLALGRLPVSSVVAAVIASVRVRGRGGRARISIALSVGARFFFFFFPPTYRRRATAVRIIRLLRRVVIIAMPISFVHVVLVAVDV